MEKRKIKKSISCIDEEMDFAWVENRTLDDVENLLGIVQPHQVMR